jgi:predicted metal-dependent hydrolase
MRTQSLRRRSDRLATADAAAFRARVARWGERIGITPERVQLQRMTAKWASCSTNGRLSFSRDLLDEDEQFQDVVIVHELLHLRVPNHGRLFRSLLGAYVPGWHRVTASRASRVCRTAG